VADPEVVVAVTVTELEPVGVPGSEGLVVLLPLPPQPVSTAMPVRDARTNAIIHGLRFRGRKNKSMPAMAIVPSVPADVVAAERCRAAEEALVPIVSLTDPVLPAATVRLEGEKAQVDSLGRPVHWKLTVPLRELLAATLKVREPVLPLVMLRDVALELNEKSGAGGGLATVTPTAAAVLGLKWVSPE